MAEDKNIQTNDTESLNNEHHSHKHHHSHHHHSHHSHNTKKRSVWKKISHWFDKKSGSKSGNAINVIIVCVTIVLLISSIFIDVVRRKEIDELGEYQGSSGASYNSASFASVSVPAYWDNEISEKTEAIKKLQSEGGKDCVSFVWASDTHIPDNGSGRTNNIGKVMAKLLTNCDIPYAVITGDIGTRSSHTTEEELVESQKMISQHLAPLWGTDRLLVALGNHDGCWGSSNGYYRHQFSPERMWDFYFRFQAIDENKIFSDDGLYYYIDNSAQKTRYIVLNSHFAGVFAENESGWAVNNRFHTSCYGQKQLDWLADEALDMPEGYSAVIAVHAPPVEKVNNEEATYTVDYFQFQGIVDAYNNKTTYSGRCEGVEGWTKSDIDVDFTTAHGEIIAIFAGHIHQDTVDTKTLTCPIITIISSGAAVNEGEMPERKFGTDTETSFDVVTINKKTRTIYCTRVGAGDDRTISY